MRFLVTAGPTVEEIDPVRFISNYSTGTMGYTIARTLRKRGYYVILISGPVSIPEPAGVKVIKVTTAREMEKAVINNLRRCDCIIMSAAVCDFRVKMRARVKIKKKKDLMLHLVRNVDILEKIKGRDNIFKTGFALETDHVMGNARKKLREKKLDLIVVNTIGADTTPFGTDIDGRPARNYSILSRDGSVMGFFKKTKKQMALAITKEIEKRLVK